MTTIQRALPRLRPAIFSDDDDGSKFKVSDACYIWISNFFHLLTQLVAQDTAGAAIWPLPQLKFQTQISLYKDNRESLNLQRAQGHFLISNLLFFPLNAIILNGEKYEEFSIYDYRTRDYQRVRAIRSYKCDSC